ncbi:MAG: hypothetical protein AB1457_08040 [Chloroflexota bacterium]
MLDMTLTGLRHREGVGEAVGEMSRFARHDINRFTSPQDRWGGGGGDPSLTLGMTLISVYVTASERSERGGLPQNRWEGGGGDPSLTLGGTLSCFPILAPYRKMGW